MSVTIEKQLNELVKQKAALENTLRDKGVNIGENETLNSLVIKIDEELDTGGGGEDSWIIPVDEYNDTSLVLLNCVKSIEVPEGVTTIPASTFANSTSLTSIDIPNSVTSIGAGTFQSCTSLTSIDIPNSVTSIAGSTFSGCSSLKSVTIPNSVTSIGSHAFYHCSALKTLTIPGNTTLDTDAFYGTSINELIFADGSTTITYYSSPDLSITSITSVTIPDSVTSIGNLAFYRCTLLTSVTIPDSVTSIGMYTFSGCTSLESVTIGNSVETIGDYAFDSCSNLQYIYFSGTEEKWNTITFGVFWNSKMGSAVEGGTQIIYNYTPEEL